MTDGLQLIFAVLLVALGLMITFCSGRKLFNEEETPETKTVLADSKA